MSFKDQIKSPAEATTASGIKLLVYGDSGVGKTTLCATTGDPRKTLVLSAERGLLSIRNSEVDCVEISTLHDLRDALVFLSKSKHDYEWVCLDSISEIAEQVLAQEMESNKDRRQAYGETASTVLRIIKAFRDLPLNVCVVCKGIQTDDDGRLVWSPFMPGAKLAAALPYLFDEVFCLVAQQDKEGKVRRALRTTADGRYTAKDRSGRLLPWEDPDLAQIYSKIYGPA